MHSPAGGLGVHITFSLFKAECPYSDSGILITFHIAIYFFSSGLWSLAWRILSITLLACEMSAIVTTHLTPLPQKRPSHAPHFPSGHWARFCQSSRFTAFLLNWPGTALEKNMLANARCWPCEQSGHNVAWLLAWQRLRPLPQPVTAEGGARQRGPCLESPDLQLYSALT